MEKKAFNCFLCGHGFRVIIYFKFFFYFRIGKFSEAGKGTPEDLLYFYSHLDAGGTVRRIDEVLLIYRYHPDATTFSVDELVDLILFFIN